jgi:hypothetical protein
MGSGDDRIAGLAGDGKPTLRPSGAKTRQRPKPFMRMPSRARLDQLESSPTMIMRTVVQLHNRTFNVQRHLTSARTHRAFRASAMQAWREAALRPGSERIKYANEAPQKLRKRPARGRSARRWPFRGKLFRLRLRATASLARPRSGRPSIPAHSRKSSIHYAPELCNKKGF